MLSTFSLGLGASLVLAGVLLVAAALKAGSLARFEYALVQLLPAWLWRKRILTSRTLALSTIGLEAAVGVSLLIAPGEWMTVTGVFAMVLTLGLLAASERARRLRVVCGCFGSSRVTRGREVARTALIAGLAAVTLISSIVSDGWPGVTALDAGGLMVAVVIGFVLFALSSPAERKESPRTPTAPQSRRTFLRSTAGAAMSIVGFGILVKQAYSDPPKPAGPLTIPHAPPEHVTASRSCFDRFTSCTGCCGGSIYDPDHSCRDCCSDCFGQCGSGSDCSILSCFRDDDEPCWPPTNY